MTLALICPGVAFVVMGHFFLNKVIASKRNYSEIWLYLYGLFPLDDCFTVYYRLAIDQACTKTAEVYVRVCLKMIVITHRKRRTNGFGWM